MSHNIYFPETIFLLEKKKGKKYGSMIEDWKKEKASKTLFPDLSKKMKKYIIGKIFDRKGAHRDCAMKNMWTNKNGLRLFSKHQSVFFITTRNYVFTAWLR